VLSYDIDASKVETDNAGLLFKAINLLKFPVDKNIEQKIEDVIENGWHRNDEVLENFIKENKQCFEILEKAKYLTKCDFGYRKKYKYLFEKELLPYAQIMRLCQLLLLNARYNEY